MMPQLLCEFCRTLLVNAREYDSTGFSFSEWRPCQPLRDVNYDAGHLEELCDFCAFVVEIVPAAERAQLIEALDPESLIYERGGGLVKLWEEQESFRGCIGYREEDSFHPLCCFVLLPAEGNTRLSRARPIDASSATTGPLDGVAITKKWLTDCDQSHSACIETLDPKYHPHRLLYIAKNDQGIPEIIALRDKEFPATVCYATLSYCWGTNPNFLRLRRDNYEQLLTGVSIIKLPRTFVEAISFTAQLGLAYIWIDALCIIQDSEEDWKTESALMSAVYRSGYINIAAAASDSPEGGLLRDRSRIIKWMSGIPVEFRGKNSKPEKYVAIESDQWYTHIERSPLLRRGWVLQERMLSPRTVYFGRQVFWECLHHSFSESFPSGTDHSNSGNNSFTEQPKKRLAGALELDAHAGRSGYLDSMCNFWVGLIWAYSLCRLTKSSDKLIAMEGIVQDLKSATGIKDCYFGMWEQLLPQTLIWCCYKGCKRYSERIAPTWSWASIDGGILPRWTESGINAKVLDIQVESDHPVRAKITLSGRFCEGLWDSGSLRLIAGTINDISMWFDEDNETDAASTLLCFEIGTENGLLLEPSTCRSGEFSRIGTYDLSPESYEGAFRIPEIQDEWSGDLDTLEMIEGKQIMDKAMRTSRLDPKNYLAFDGVDRYTISII